MAASRSQPKPRPKRGPGSLFALAERQIVGLYDAGVMSPAVLHHLVAAYAESGIDWNGDGTLRTVDGHGVQEAVVIVMMPGRALKTARKDFISVVEHLAGASSVAEQADDAPDDEDLLSQLSGDGTRSSTRAAKKTGSPSKRAGFNPLVGARSVPGHGKR
ncbi:hypothetical protein QCE63_30390 [Caballeronia sp. LZ065]|uniref:hypothetical protein n=1 Tax=Caballeronia sp. LZ065 TaxID=3038571 RepID=UPI00285DBB3D|nr:hypothetical protein [Caballeronia sp. LZ065]MDR5783728.1 hypothetical protein [Caballeronia sp. LZ065]